MRVSDEIEIGSAVFFKCTNPAMGFVKRIAKDKSWADVEWQWGLGCRGARRARMADLVKLTPILNQHLASKGEL